MREKALLLSARHGRAIQVRYWIVAFGLIVALGDAIAGICSGLVCVLPTMMLLCGVANAIAEVARRRGPVHVWHFWGMMPLDTLVIGCAVGSLGQHGTLRMSFYVVAAASYALGLPRVA